MQCCLQIQLPARSVSTNTTHQVWLLQRIIDLDNPSTMAMVDKLAMLCTMAMVDLMHMVPSPNRRSQEALEQIAELFESQGWERRGPAQFGHRHPDLIVQKDSVCFVMEIKALAEGRADRVIPLLSQAILEAQAQAMELNAHMAHVNAQPLAIVWVEHASEALLQQVQSFAVRYAPKVPFGFVSGGGLIHFSDPALHSFNAQPSISKWQVAAPSIQSINLFSDLGQWMLKLLLAPDIPEELLNAPRRRYRSGADLAAAAQASNMSASRLLQQLRSEGYLDEASRDLVLVRRSELFRRWRAAVMRPILEMPMRFLIKGNVQQQLHSIMAKQPGQACLGLFAAADALRMGHVSGVPPYLYVQKLPRPGEQQWRSLVASSPSEVPDVILRHAPYPKSTLRGAMQHNGIAACDVIQIWLDVANHPARGEEQAELIYRKYLLPIIDKGQ